MKKALLLIAVVGGLFGLFLLISDDTPQNTTNQNQETQQVAELITSEDVPEIIREKYDKKLASATFAGGCFWCTEAAFQETKGVENAISGYAGGEEYNPTYTAVIEKRTSHREAIKVFYDPNVVSYEE